MYEGSMVGSGTHVFALMGYIIANQKPDPAVGGQVRLNAKVLATIFGDTEHRIQEAIDFLCAPDPKSTTPDEDGRRLVKIGQFDYRVVNAAKYLAIRNEEERREANRIRQANHRGKKKKAGDGKKSNLPGEQEAMEAHGNGDEAKFDQIVTDNLPKKCQ